MYLHFFGEPDVTIFVLTSGFTPAQINIGGSGLEMYILDFGGWRQLNGKEMQQMDEDLLASDYLERLLRCNENHRVIIFLDTIQFRYYPWRVPPKTGA